jgi:hypothetical protein
MRPEKNKQGPGEPEDPLSFAGHSLRELPVPARAYHLAGEIAAGMDRAEKRLRSQQESHAAEVDARIHALAQVTQFVFHMEKAIQAAEATRKGHGPDPEIERMRILKDQIKAHLASQGLTWRDPTGEAMTEELEACFEVDRWQYSGTIEQETVIEARQPVILFSGNVILRGNVVVAVPDR